MIKSSGPLLLLHSAKGPQTLIITIGAPVLVTAVRTESSGQSRQDRHRSCDTCAALGGESPSGAHPATVNRSPLHWYSIQTAAPSP
jgi:hypothetical protein